MTRGVGFRFLTTAAVVGIGLLCISSAAVAVPTSSGDPKHAFTRQDQRWAKNILLRRTELPTGVKWTAYSTGGGGGGGAGSSPGCPGTLTNYSDLTQTGEAGSPLFITTNRQFVIFSAAWIYKTSSDAASFVDRLTAAFVRCGTAALKSEIGATNSAQLLSNGVHPISGTHRWWNYRIVLKLHAQGKTLKSYVDLGLGHVGRATAWLLLHGAYAPIPNPVEAELVHVVQARMAKSPH